MDRDAEGVRLLSIRPFRVGKSLAAAVVGKCLWNIGIDPSVPLDGAALSTSRKLQAVSLTFKLSDRLIRHRHHLVRRLHREVRLACGAAAQGAVHRAIAAKRLRQDRACTSLTIVDHAQKQCHIEKFLHGKLVHVGHFTLPAFLQLKLLQW